MVSNLHGASSGQGNERQTMPRGSRMLFWRLTGMHVGWGCVCVCVWGGWSEGRQLNMHEKAYAFQQH